MDIGRKDVRGTIFPNSDAIFPSGFLSDSDVYSLSFHPSTSLNHSFWLQLCARRAVWTKEQDAIVDLTRDKRRRYVKLWHVDVIDSAPTSSSSKNQRYFEGPPRICPRLRAIYSTFLSSLRRTSTVFPSNCDLRNNLAQSELCLSNCILMQFLHIFSLYYSTKRE